MKTKISQKAIKKAFTNVIRLGYCQAPYLLARLEPNFYTTSKLYGWRADVYIVDNKTAIVTGYNTFGDINPSRELIEKYDRLAAKGLMTTEELITCFVVKARQEAGKA